jgi:putative nucleotidyltransferase with HDIG domain
VTALLYPAVANQLPDPLNATILNARGVAIVNMAADPAKPAHCLCSSGQSLASWPHVGQVLEGISDNRGPKFAGLLRVRRGAILYTIGPVLDHGRVVGAVVVSESLSTLLQGTGSADPFPTAIFAPNGVQLASAPGFPAAAAPLSAGDRNQLTASRTSAAAIHRPVGAAGEVFFLPVVIREEVAGYAAVIVPAAVVGDLAGTLPALLVAISVGALVLTLATGAFVTRRITRPLGRLLYATDRVTDGDLHHVAPVTSLDEVGQLTLHFNDMTASLRDKTELLEASTEETVRALAAAIDARDAYTHGHSVRVANYSVALARAAGLPDQDIETIQRGCLVHDIGKIGVPDRILSKRGRLTREEAAEMRLHPVVGHRMIRHLRWYGEVLDIVLHHHERWDGNGYPSRLKEYEIPPLARMTAIADTLDAMTSHRPYRKAFTFRKASALIEAGAGTQFDPGMVEIFRQASATLAEMVGREFSLGGPADPDLEEVIGMVS